MSGDVSGPLDNFLERFRRAGGVPAAVGGGVEAELAPLFTELDVIEREVAALQVRAEAEHGARMAQLERELAQIAEDADRRAERARDAAYEAAREVVEAEVARIAADGERGAAATRVRGAERLAILVADVVGRVAGIAP